MGEVSAESQLTGDGMTGTVETPPPHRSLEEDVAEILRETSAPPAEAPETEAQAEHPPAEKWDLKTVAEKLQVDPAKLYDLTVKAGDGQELSIGQLKDAYKAQAELDSLRTNLTKARGEFEADQIRQQRELEQILSAIPQQAINPQLAEVWQRQRSERLSRETEALLRAIPEWSDTGVVTAERKQIQDYLSQFGWPEGVLDRIEDHRLFVTIRAAAKDRAELMKLKAEKAKAEQPKPKAAAAPRPGKPQTEAQRFGQLKGAVTSGRMGKVEAVAQILSGVK